MSASPYPSGCKRFVTDEKNPQVIGDHALACDGAFEPASTSTRRREPGTSGNGPQAGQASQGGAEGRPARQRTGKLLVDKDAGGMYHFTLVASNGQVIATSEAYERRQAALNGIEAVKKNAPTPR